MDVLEMKPDGGVPPEAAVHRMTRTARWPGRCPREAARQRERWQREMHERFLGGVADVREGATY